MGWSHWICDTITGRKLLEVHPSDASWKTSITSIGGGAHTFQLRDADTRLDRATWQTLTVPWARTVVVCWDDAPVYAGLVMGHTYDPFTGVLEVRHREVRCIWGSRMPFTVPEYQPNGVSAAAGKSLRGVMRQIIAWGSVAKPVESTWWLPIVLPPDEDGPHTRSWQHYNFETVEQMLSQIEGEDSGPDLNLRPRWNAAGRLEWEARIGALGGPTFEYDLTADSIGMTGFPVVTDASRQLTGTFGLGQGSEADMLVGLGQNTDVPEGPFDIPNLDATRPFKNVADPVALRNLAIGELRAFRWPSTTAVPELLAADVLPAMVLGSTVRAWIEGDEFLSDGWRVSTVTGMSGYLSEKLTLEVQ